MNNYDATTAKGDCIFCKIIDGEIGTPGIFWENENFIAFLSKWPNTPGFTVLAPKKHYGSDCLAMPDEDLQAFIIAAKKVSSILLQHFDDVGRVGLMMEGTGVNHAHIKLFPMHGTGYMKQGEWKQHSSGRSDFFESYPGYLISNDGPEADEGELSELAQALRKIG